MSTRRETDEDRRIIRYLLQDLPEDEAEKIEERYVCEASYFDYVTELEEQLIRRYLDETLPPSDASLFERKYLAVAHLRRKTEVARQLREEAATRWVPPPVGEPWWKRLLHPQIAMPLFACIPLLLSAMGWLVLQDARLRTEVLRLRHTADVERARGVNAPAVVSSGPVMSFVLLPGVTKSLSSDRDRRVSWDAGLKELRIQFELPGTTEDFPVALEVFRLELEGRRFILHRTDLHTFQTASGRSLVWAASPQELGPGNYLAFVKRSVKGLDEVLESFSWTVVRP